LISSLSSVLMPVGVIHNKARGRALFFPVAFLAALATSVGAANALPDATDPNNFCWRRPSSKWL
jgi:hypothetical protein